MVHTFKIGGHRIAYDSVSGYMLPLSELTYKMLDYITLPMPEECSSALRYDLAKFDSADIRKEYNRVYELYREGKLFAQDNEENGDYNGAVIMLGETVVNRDCSGLMETVEKLAEENKDCTLRIKSATAADSAFSAVDVAKLDKLFTELAKLQIHRTKAGDTSVNIFTKVDAVCHNDEACKFCWAKKLCSQNVPGAVVCELEKKRIECTMAVEAKA